MSVVFSFIDWSTPKTFDFHSRQQVSYPGLLFSISVVSGKTESLTKSFVSHCRIICLLSTKDVVEKCLSLGFYTDVTRLFFSPVTG